MLIFRVVFPSLTKKSMCSLLHKAGYNNKFDIMISVM